MLSYPTDLTPQEQQTAHTWLRELAEKFTTEGTLRSRQWREVFHRTWRHPYVVCRPSHRRGWRRPHRVG